MPTISHYRHRKRSHFTTVSQGDNVYKKWVDIVHGKDYSGQQAKRLAKSVVDCYAGPHQPEREFGWVTETTDAYVRSVRRIVVRDVFHISGFLLTHLRLAVHDQIVMPCILAYGKNVTV